MSFSKSTHLIYPKISIISVAKICVLTSVIYSESADKTYCFYCKLHTQESTSSLAHGGFYDLANVFRRLKEHEKSKHHVNATA